MPDSPWERLLAVLRPGKPVAVQMHDRPDVDAFAAAFGLGSLLRLSGFQTQLAWKSPARSRSLENLRSRLSLDCSAWEGSDDASIVVVDGIPENGNVTLVRGVHIASIDHHESSAESRAEFSDIRPELGSCCSIIESYWHEASRVPDQTIATALLAGLESDTDFLSRDVGEQDLTAYSRLSHIANRGVAAQIVKIILDSTDLGILSRAIGDSATHKGKFYATLPEPCCQECPAVLADFALRAADITVAIVAVIDDEGCRVSVRSRDSEIAASLVVRAALDGIGSGGGHYRGAGGFIPSASYPGERRLKARFFAVIDTLAMKRRSTNDQDTPPR